MASDLTGSYEQAPPNLIELVARDRRWCQGNLQHMRLIFASGLHPLSRLHLAMGAMSYIASPLWLLFLLSGMILALYAYIVPPDYFAEEWSLFPTWPRIDAERAIALFIASMVVLFLPKLLGTLLHLREPEARGHPIATLVSFLFETVLSALIAPILMLTQSRAVFQILTGRDSGWNVQSRKADRLPWRILFQFHHIHTVVGIALAVAAWAISWSLLAWMSPAVLGLTLSMPVAALISSRRIGLWLKRRGLLITPEERSPPAIAVEADAGVPELELRTGPPPDIHALLTDAAIWQRHLAWLDTWTQRRPGEPDPVLANARLKLADGLDPACFDAAEQYAAISSPSTLEKLRLHRSAGE
jgi:membrane glycosyltransferase